MFTIDLLKGERVPIKSGPEGIAVGAVTLVVPVIIAIAMLGFYLINSITISIQRQDITRYVEKTNELSKALKLQKSFEVEKKNINSGLSEVASSLSRHTQWSPILATIVKNIPETIMLTRLEVTQRTVKKKIPSKDDPKKTVTIGIPARTLQMNVCGSQQSDSGKAVKDFKDRLWSSSILGPRLEEIRVSQESDMLGGQPIVSYGIDCIFKPGL